MTAPLQRRPERLERGTAYAKPPPIKQPGRAPAHRRSTACRSRPGRRCSPACSPASGSSSAPTRTGAAASARCSRPTARARRTDFLSFARAWDRFARCRGASRPATEREVRILVAHLRASLEEADGLELDRAIAEHRSLLAAAMRRGRLRSDEHDPAGEIRARRLTSPRRRTAGTARRAAVRVRSRALAPGGPGLSPGRGYAVSGGGAVCLASSRPAMLKPRASARGRR